MFTLRHMDADLLRFDWLPDRGGRQEVRIDRVFPAAARFLPLDLRPSPTDEDLANLDRYAAARRPVLCPDFDAAAAARLTRALRARLRRVAASFRFTRHPRHDLPAAWLRVLESFVRAKAAELSRM